MKLLDAEAEPDPRAARSGRERDVFVSRVRRTWAAAALAAMLGAAPAGAETLIFKDALRPHGHARSQAEKEAAFAACKAEGISDENVPAVEGCLRKQGWVLAGVKPDESDHPGATYDDMRQPPNGPRRSNEILRADIRACDPAGKMYLKSPVFQRCMLAHGWRFAFYIPAPAGDAGASSPAPYVDPNTGLTCHGQGAFLVCSNF